MRAAPAAALALLTAVLGFGQQHADIDPDAGFLDPDRTEPAFTHYQTFFSKTIHGDASYLVYLPPGYDSSAERYPVVYWLHGLNGTQRSGAPFVARLDAAIQAGQCPPVIAILVNGIRDSRYYDSWDGRRPWETVFIHDLIPHVDATYRTRPQREYRAIEGFSMGGFGAAHLGFKYPELFGAISIFSGALLDDDSVASAPDLVTTPELFEKNFGSNKAYFHAGSPWVVVKANASKIRGRTFVRIGVGDQDGLLGRVMRYHQLLTSLGIEHDFFTVPGVGHNTAKFYEARGAAGFAFYSKAFGLPPAPPVSRSGASDPAHNAN